MPLRTLWLAFLRRITRLTSSEFKTSRYNTSVILKCSYDSEIVALEEVEMKHQELMGLWKEAWTSPLKDSTTLSPWQQLGITFLNRYQDQFKYALLGYDIGIGKVSQLILRFNGCTNNFRQFRPYALFGVLFKKPRENKNVKRSKVVINASSLCMTPPPSHPTSCNQLITITFHQSHSHKWLQSNFKIYLFMLIDSSNMLVMQWQEKTHKFFPEEELKLLE